MKSNSSDIQKNLLEIIERTKAQNEVLKKLLEAMTKQEGDIDKLKQFNSNQNFTK